MKKNYVNSYMVAALLDPFLFLDDEAVNRVAEIEAQDEGALRECIAQLITPYFQSFDEKSKADVRNSLAYMLARDIGRWEGLLDRHQCPLQLPHPRRFFELIWDELFQTKVFLEDDGDYLVKEDKYAPNLIRRKKA